MSNKFQVHKVVELPEGLEADSIYFVAPVGKPDYVEIYVTDTSGSKAKRVLNEDDVQALIVSELGSFTGPTELEVFDTIADRDDTTPEAVSYAYVVDASADPTVESGGASYIYNAKSSEWVKTSGSDIPDLALDWDSIKGRPSSTPTQIDQAVSQAHTHDNKEFLDKVGEDEAGDFTYGGVKVSAGSAQWATTNW